MAAHHTGKQASSPAPADDASSTSVEAYARGDAGNPTNGVAGESRLRQDTYCYQLRPIRTRVLCAQIVAVSSRGSQKQRVTFDSTVPNRPQNCDGGAVLREALASASRTEPSGSR
jgi:hypothetical protein